MSLNLNCSLMFTFSFKCHSRRLKGLRSTCFRLINLGWCVYTLRFSLWYELRLISFNFANRFYIREIFSVILDIRIFLCSISVWLIHDDWAILIIFELINLWEIDIEVFSVDCKAVHHVQESSLVEFIYDKHLFKLFLARTWCVEDLLS